jgi:predicted dehydrogenase
VLEGTAAVIHRNREPASVFRRREPGGRPLADVERIDLEPRPATGQLLLQDFVNAIRTGESVRVPAEQAARAVELANAILLSALEECPVELPIDGALFAQTHEKLSRGGVRRMSG